MKRLLSLMVASMLIPSTVLASSIRPGSRPPTRTPKSPLCLDEEEKFTEKCDILIDDTGVEGPEGKITNVVQWQTQDKDFSVGGAIVGGAVGTGAGFAAGLGSCAFLGPFCLITAPAIMNTGMNVGGKAGGKGTGKFFTIVGDDAEGNRLIGEVYYKKGKAVRKASKDLLRTTELAEGEVRK